MLKSNLLAMKIKIIKTAMSPLMILTNVWFLVWQTMGCPIIGQEDILTKKCAIEADYRGFLDGAQAVKHKIFFDKNSQKYPKISICDLLFNE